MIAASFDYSGEAIITPPGLCSAKSRNSAIRRSQPFPGRFTRRFPADCGNPGGKQNQAGSYDYGGGDGDRLLPVGSAQASRITTAS